MKRIVLVACLGASGVACEVPEGKVAQGQLYLSGEARFDAYFKDVHAIQVWAAEWPEDRKATRKPLVSILDLTSDGADVTIVQATHEKIAMLANGGTVKLDASPEEAHVSASGAAKPDPALFRAIEDTAGGELQRAKKLNSMLPKIEELEKVGHSLEPHVLETFQRQTPGKVAEVKSELSASVSVLNATALRARRAIRECDDFVSDLQRAVAAGSGVKREPERAERAERTDKSDKPDKATEKPKDAPKPKPKVDAPPKPAPVAKKDEAPKPKADAPPPAAPPPVKPKPAEGEVFNP